MPTTKKKVKRKPKVEPLVKFKCVECTKSNWKDTWSDAINAIAFECKHCGHRQKWERKWRPV